MSAGTSEPRPKLAGIGDWFGVGFVTVGGFLIGSGAGRGIAAVVGTRDRRSETSWWGWLFAVFLGVSLSLYWGTVAAPLEHRVEVRSTLIASFGVAALCVAWGLLMNTAMNGGPAQPQDVGVALGMGGVVFVTSGVGASLVYAFTRSRKRALWGWLLLALDAFAFLGIGAAQSARLPS